MGKRDILELVKPTEGNLEDLAAHPQGDLLLEGLNLSLQIIAELQQAPDPMTSHNYHKVITMMEQYGEIAELLEISSPYEELLPRLRENYAKQSYYEKTGFYPSTKPDVEKGNFQLS